MKILHVNTNEISGGAGRAANRLHQGLLMAGLDSYLFVQSRITNSERVLAAQNKLDKGLDALRPTIDNLPLSFFAPAGLNQFSLAWIPDRLAKINRSLQADLVHLHWIAKGFIRIESLKQIDQPVVWTLHDMWPMTGGCFHSGDCLKYQSKCGSCPKLRSSRENDLSQWVWRRKQQAWNGKKLVVVCPSQWMAERASTSSMFSGYDIRVIANGLDLKRYHPIDQAFAQDALGLDPGKRYLLYSAINAAINPFKGFDLLPEITGHLVSLGWSSQIELLMLGEVETEETRKTGIPVRCLGHLSDDASLALAYNASDLFLAPSKIDNLPNTVMESLACGTPVAAFEVGGIPEMIDPFATGWLAAPGDVSGFASGVDWLLRDQDRLNKFGATARQSAIQKFDIIKQAKQYIELYQTMVGEKRRAERG